MRVSGGERGGGTPISVGRILKRASREPPKWSFRRLNGDEGAIHGGIPREAKIPLQTGWPRVYRSGSWGSLRIASGRWPRASGEFEDGRGADVYGCERLVGQGVFIVSWWSSTPCEGKPGGASLQDAGCLVAGDPGALPREKIGRPFRAPSSGAGGPGALPRATLGSAVGAGGGLSRWGGQRKNGADGTDGTNGRQMRDGFCGEGREW